MARVQVIRTRGYCFTLNNPQEGDEETLLGLGYKYITFGREVGNNGTPHLQGYIHFAHPQRFTTVKRMVQRWHVEPRNGTIQQAITYCHKDGDYVERGDIPLDPATSGKKGGEANKQRWSNILQRAKDGDTEWIESNEPKVFLQFMPRLDALRLAKPPILDELTNEWWVGSTGTGKSKLLWELYPDHFPKSLNKWWDGYTRTDVVAIEEWAPKNEITGSFLKIWTDHYPFNGEIKGGTLMHLRPKKVIILSNYTIEECFLNEQDRQPLLRRFNVLRFPQDIPWARSTHQYFRESQKKLEQTTNIEDTATNSTTESAPSSIDSFDWASLADINIEDADQFAMSENLLSFLD